MGQQERIEVAGIEDRRRMSSDGLVTGVLAGLVLLLALIITSYGFGWQWTGFPNKNLFDWLQISVFPAAVAIGAFLLNQSAKVREDERNRAKARNEDRKDVLARVTSAYNDTKKARRILKAHSVTDEETGERGISCTVYEDQLKMLMDPQLQFELYKKSPGGAAVNAFLRAFRDPDDIAERLEDLETYLHGVIQEYDGGKYQERKQQRNGDHSCRVLLKDFESLDEFVTKSSFINGFSSKFRYATAQIQKEILDL